MWEVKFGLQSSKVQSGSDFSPGSVSGLNNSGLGPDFDQVRTELGQPGSRRTGWVSPALTSHSEVRLDGLHRSDLLFGASRWGLGKPKFFSPKMASFQNSGHVKLLLLLQLFENCSGKVRAWPRVFNPATWPDQRGAIETEQLTLCSLIKSLSLWNTSW